MKRKIVLLITTMVIGLCFGACDKKENVEGSLPKVEEEGKQNTSADDKKEEAVVDDLEKEQSEEKEQSQEEESQAVTVKIYYGNANADGYDTEDVSISEITPDVLIQQLASKNMLPAEVSVLNFTQSQVDGKNAIDLDLSSEYGSFIETQGTAGEKMSIGSISDTFLNAYHCELIRITVVGNTLMSSHRDYPDYMGMF